MRYGTRRPAVRKHLRNPTPRPYQTKLHSGAFSDPTKTNLQCIAMHQTLANCPTLWQRQLQQPGVGIVINLSPATIIIHSCPQKNDVENSSTREAWTFSPYLMWHLTSTLPESTETLPTASTPHRFLAAGRAARCCSRIIGEVRRFGVTRRA